MIRELEEKLEGLRSRVKAGKLKTVKEILAAAKEILSYKDGKRYFAGGVVKGYGWEGSARRKTAERPLLSESQELKLLSQNRHGDDSFSVGNVKDFKAVKQPFLFLRPMPWGQAGDELQPITGAVGVFRVPARGPIVSVPRSVLPQQDAVHRCGGQRRTRGFAVSVGHCIKVTVGPLVPRGDVPEMANGTIE